MSNPEFKPKLGKPRSAAKLNPSRLTRMVVKAATRHRTPKSPWANALTRRPVAELGSGKGALYGLTRRRPAGAAPSQGAHCPARNIGPRRRAHASALHPARRSHA